MSPDKAERNSAAGVAKADLKLEAVVIPVSDVDRSKEFYSNLGWKLDADFPFDNGFRVVQFTPPGSGCSVQFGTKITTAPPASGRRIDPAVGAIRQMIRIHKQSMAHCNK